MTRLWAVEASFDWGKTILWSGWDTRYNGPNGDLLPILFRTREAARAWVRERRANGVVGLRVVKVSIS